MVELEGFPGIKGNSIKAHVDSFVFLDGHSLIMLASGRCASETVFYEGLPTTGTSMTTL